MGRRTAAVFVSGEEFRRCRTPRRFCRRDVRERRERPALANAAAIRRRRGLSILELPLQFAGAGADEHAAQRIDEGAADHHAEHPAEIDLE